MKLLIVGDSFHEPDNNFPGEHWSEQLNSKFIVHNLAVGGSSNVQILDQLLLGLEKYNPDAVFIGFTDIARVDIKPITGTLRKENTWFTHLNKQGCTPRQKEYASQVLKYTPMEAEILRNFSVLFFALELLRNKLPYTWTMGGATPIYKTPEIYRSALNATYEKHRKYEMEINLYDIWVENGMPRDSKPCYHVDGVHQNLFAEKINEVFLPK